MHAAFLFSVFFFKSDATLYISEITLGLISHLNVSSFCSDEGQKWLLFPFSSGPVCVHTAIYKLYQDLLAWSLLNYVGGDTRNDE